jgi:ubiquinone/menaquinone biosynthesis C-methylase UbiE
VDYYNNLAKYYDEMKSFDSEKLSFLKSIFDGYKDPVILDCACGTGYDMEILINNGYNCIGSDLSESMLNVCRSRFASKDIEISEVSFEFLDEFYTQKFDVILCLSNSINELHVDPIKALNSMKRVLKPNGRIMFDQGQTDYTMRNPPSEEVVVDTPNFKRKMNIDYNGDVMTVYITDDIMTPRKLTMNSSIDIKLRLQDDWQTIINQCSLESEIFGWWDKTIYDKSSSERLIVVAKKLNVNE